MNQSPSIYFFCLLNKFMVMLFGQTFRRPHTSIMQHVYLMHKQLLIKENSHLVTTHFNNNPPIESINMGSVFAITHTKSA